MTTLSRKPADVVPAWYLVDADGQILGRLAAMIAHRLRGKHRPDYTPHVDTGDYIVVINAERIAVTGNKLQQKQYHRHSGYPGGLKTTGLAEVLKKKPEEVIRRAVTGMLPRNSLGRTMARKLKIYAGASHPHAGQQPLPLSLRARGAAVAATAEQA